MKKLAKNVNAYFLTSRTIISMFVYAFLIVSIVLPKEVYSDEVFKIILIVISGLLTLITIPFHLIAPFFIYKLNGYEIKEEEIIISKGVFIRREAVIPIKRIEHVETFKGPIQMLFKQGTVRIYTSGSQDFIIGLSEEDAYLVFKKIREKLLLYLNKDEDSE